MRDNHLIIGICSSTGPGSGKTYAHQLLKEIFGKEVRVSHNPLAGALKTLYGEMIRKLRGNVTLDGGVDADKGMVVADIHCCGAYGGSYPATGRDFLVALGQGARHAFGPSFWLDLCVERIFSTFDAIHGDAVCVVDDVRYNNEARKILSLNNSLLLCIEREGHVVEDSGDLDYKAIASHPRVIKIVNNGDPVAFHEALLLAVDKGLTTQLPHVTIK